MLNIVILAAGMGKRMYSNIPKVLHSIADKPMLHHVIDTAKQLNPKRLVIVVGHMAEAVEQSLQKAYPQNAYVLAYQHQQLGTAHALQQALPYLENDVPTLVLYGDVPLTQLVTLEALYQTSQKTENAKNTEILALLTANYENSTGYGRIIRDENQAIIAIVEEKDANPAQKAIQEINTGMMLLPTKYIQTALAQIGNQNAQKEYYLTDIIAMAAKQNMPIIGVQPSVANWETYGVNNKQQLNELERIHQINQADQLLLQGVMLYDKARIDIRGQLTCGNNVSIDVGCIFKGKVHLADNVQVDAYSIIEETTIGKDTHIKPYSHISHACIENNVQIGPYARIRPSSHIGSYAHVGNFVELKKTTLGAYSKANHLSYLGDSVIGQHVNIGAGVITCNYDGVNKHTTTIEDDVFVGSSSQLIAPITLQAGSTIAAGTTLRKNAPAGQLTLSKHPQVSLPNWQRPKKIEK